MEQRKVLFKELEGKTIISIVGLKKDSEEVSFKTSDGRIYKMYHRQQCCEGVAVDDVCGDVIDLLDRPILLAEEVTSNENPDGVKMEYQDDSFTWTFYKISTIKGDVTIRWYGESNGYYSEEVSFIEIVN